MTVSIIVSSTMMRRLKKFLMMMIPVPDLKIVAFLDETENFLYKYLF